MWPLESTILFACVQLERTIRFMRRTHIYGGMAEWLKAAVLKTVEPQGSVGSNPTSSARLVNAPEMGRFPFSDELQPREAGFEPMRSISVKRTAQRAVRRKSARRLWPKRVIFREAENTESYFLRQTCQRPRDGAFSFPAYRTNVL